MVAAKIGLAAVCPYLVGISGKLIQGTPLSLYQWTESDKADTLKLIRVLNDKLDTPHDPVALEDNFQTKWPQLKRRIEKVIEGYSQIEDPVETVKQPLSQILTPESIELLVAACKDSGDIMYIAHLGGTKIQAGKRNFVNQGDPRSLAHWRGALDELEQHAFIESLGHQRVIYRVTRQGWSAFDEIIGTMKNGSTDVSKPLSKP